MHATFATMFQVWPRWKAAKRTGSTGGWADNHAKMKRPGGSPRREGQGKGDGEKPPPGRGHAQKQKVVVNQYCSIKKKESESEKGQAELRGESRKLGGSKNKLVN